MTPGQLLPLRPYPGIESFHYLDHPIFPGRDQESEKLLRLVTIYRGVLLYGASTAGKSSLINAGFIPKAIADGFTPDRIRVQPRREQEIIIERIAETPEAAPRYLPTSFAGPDSGDPRIVLSLAGFQAKLRNLPESVYPLLIFDQFEELVSQFEEAPPGDDLPAALEVQNNILQMLAELMRDPVLRVKLLFVFREDYLAKLGKLFVLCPNLPDTYLRLTPLRTESLHDIIHGPFDKFPDRFKPELSSVLADRLEAAIRERSKSGFLNLSETQIACLQLWRAKNPEETFTSRGVQGLLEDYLSEALNRMPGVLQDPAVALLSSMVTDSGLRNVISREDLLGRVKEEDRIPEERSEAALKALEEEKTRLIRRERRHDVVFYEIISEFLVPWIARQKAERREKQRAKAQRRRWMAVAAVLLLIAAVTASGAWLVIRSRTEAALKTDEVKRARASETGATERANQTLADLRGVKKDLEKARADIKSASTTITDRDREIAGLKDSEAKLSKRVTEVTEQHKRLSGELEAQRSLANERGKALEAQKSELSKKITDLERKLKQVRDELERLKPAAAVPGPIAAPAAGPVKPPPEKVLPRWVRIPAGEFDMGCSQGDKECQKDELPRHRVKISRAFEMSETEITLGTYRRFAEQTGRKAPEKPKFSQEDSHPVVDVTWNDAQDFCKWAGGRLPTEAEWEYAARAGSTGPRYGDLGAIAWYRGNSGDGTKPVRTRQPNQWGLYDMLGNVSEWCLDWYGPYSSGTVTNPTGAQPGSERVVRGCSWLDYPGEVRVSNRYGGLPVYELIYIGFRCVREMIP